MGKVSAEDGARVRAYPYLLAFVRPYVPGEFEQHQVVSEERMKSVTHIYVTRVDPTSVARTRIPITTQQAQTYQAFGVLDRDEATGKKIFTLPEEKLHLKFVAASIGVHASFQDYPRLEPNEAELEARAKQIAELRVRLWPDISNNAEMYASVFVQAFVFGYRLGHSMIQETTVKEQKRLLEGVCFMPTSDSYLFIEKILRSRKQEMHVDSIYDLL